MLPWWKTNGYNSSFVCQGWECMQRSRMWNRDSNGDLFLSDEWIGHKFDFSDDFTTAFYPLVERQCQDTNPSLERKAKGVYSYFENRYGSLFSPRNSSFLQDAYLYDCGKDYRITNTAHLLMSMILDGEGESSLVNVFHKPLYLISNEELLLKGIDYPAVMVRYAKNLNGTLIFNVVMNDERSGCAPQTILVDNARDRAYVITRNNVPVKTWTRASSTITIQTSICATSSIFTVQSI